MMNLQGMELRIAEDMTSVLDFISRLKNGLDDGNWHYAQDKIPDLIRNAERLKAALGYELERKRSEPAARPEAVTAAIRQYARHYAAGRALYPDQAREDRLQATADAVAEVFGEVPR